MLVFLSVYMWVDRCSSNGIALPSVLLYLLWGSEFRQLRFQKCFLHRTAFVCRLHVYVVCRYTCAHACLLLFVHSANDADRNVQLFLHMCAVLLIRVLKTPIEILIDSFQEPPKTTLLLENDPYVVPPISEA